MISILKNQFLSGILFSASFLLPASGSVAQKTDAARVFKKVSPSVVRVICMDERNRVISQASGVAVFDGSTIATNYHIIDLHPVISRIEIRQGDKSFKVTGVAGTKDSSDLMLLKISGNEFPPLKPLPFSQVSVGVSVFAIASPSGYENTITEGIISGIRTEGGKKQLQVSAPFSGGSSGGALVNGKGELIGIIKSYIRGAQNLNFGIPAEELYSLLVPGQEYEAMGEA